MFQYPTTNSTFVGHSQTLQAEEAAARQVEGARQAAAVGGLSAGAPQSSDSASLSPAGSNHTHSKSLPVAVSSVAAAPLVTVILQRPAVASVEAVPVAASAPAAVPVGPPKVDFGLPLPSSSRDESYEHFA